MRFNTNANPNHEDFMTIFSKSLVTLTQTDQNFCPLLATKVNQKLLGIRKETPYYWLIQLE